jgi:hypothetical protein
MGFCCQERRTVLWWVFDENMDDDVEMRGVPVADARSVTIFWPIGKRVTLF